MWEKILIEFVVDLIIQLLERGKVDPVFKTKFDAALADAASSQTPEEKQNAAKALQSLISSK